MSIKARKWYMQRTEYDDVYVASQISLSRNLAEFDFQPRIKTEDAERLIDKVRSLTSEIEGREGIEYYSCNVLKLTEVEKSSLVESHSLSPSLVTKKQPSGLILSEDESISIMINEEDHILIKAIGAGNNIKAVLEKANRLDDFLDSRLRYAYSDKYGYLTTCVTNVGTGMQASYMLSLPALTMSEKIRPLQEEVGKFGIVIRGVYGEDSKSAGFIYQVSNQKTLGSSEQELIENLDQITSQIVALERKTRDSWIEKTRDEIEDKVYRSYGVLKYTRSISLNDSLMLLSQIKLGSDWGILPIKGNGADIYRLMVEIQPAGIQSRSKKIMKKKECDKARAEYLNSHIPSLNEIKDN